CRHRYNVPPECRTTATIAWEAPLQASHRWDVSSGPGTLASSIVTPLSPVVSRASCSSATPGRARTQPRARGPACWGVRHRCRASCREGSCCPGSPSRRARMVTGTPLDRHEDKETSGALLDIDGARIASTRSAAGGQTYARPGPGGRAGPPPLVLGRAASSPSYKKGAALDRFWPRPEPIHPYRYQPVIWRGAQPAPPPPPSASDEPTDTKGAPNHAHRHLPPSQRRTRNRQNHRPLRHHHPSRRHRHRSEAGGTAMTRQTPEQRLLAKIKIDPTDPDACWVWTG